jgi:hypothetical protein
LGTGNSLKFTYEHKGFRKFSRGLYPRTPFIREGQGRKGRELGGRGSGIGREGRGRKGQRRGEGKRGKGRIPYFDPLALF